MKKILSNINFTSYMMIIPLIFGWIFYLFMNYGNFTSRQTTKALSILIISSVVCIPNSIYMIRKNYFDFKKMKEKNRDIERIDTYNNQFSIGDVVMWNGSRFHEPYTIDLPVPEKIEGVKGNIVKIEKRGCGYYDLIVIEYPINLDSGYGDGIWGKRDHCYPLYSIQCIKYELPPDDETEFELDYEEEENV